MARGIMVTFFAAYIRIWKETSETSEENREIVIAQSGQKSILKTVCLLFWKKQLFQKWIADLSWTEDYQITLRTMKVLSKKYSIASLSLNTIII